MKVRATGPNYGGIALYSRGGGILVIHLAHSAVAERSWHVAHADIGGILLGLWYRPPGADARDISSFDNELLGLSLDMIGALAVGGMKVLHKS